MTTPDLSFIIPSKWKAGAALIGSALSFVVPYVLQVQDALPSPWPAVIGVVLLILSALGVYHAPYVPTGTVLVPAAADRRPVIRRDDSIQTGEYTNPWQ